MSARAMRDLALRGAQLEVVPRQFGLHAQPRPARSSACDAATLASAASIGAPHAAPQVELPGCVEAGLVERVRLAERADQLVAVRPGPGRRSAGWRRRFRSGADARRAALAPSCGPPWAPQGGAARGSARSAAQRSADRDWRPARWPAVGRAPGRRRRSSRPAGRPSAPGGARVPAALPRRRAMRPVGRRRRRGGPGSRGRPRRSRPARRRAAAGASRRRGAVQGSGAQACGSPGLQTRRCAEQPGRPAAA